MNIIWCLIDSLKHVVEKIKRHISQGPDQTALILTLGLSTTFIQNLRVNMLWSVNGTAKCISVVLFLPVYFFLISSWLGQDFYIITRPKNIFSIFATLGIFSRPEYSGKFHWKIPGVEFATQPWRKESIFISLCSYMFHN